MKVKSGRSSRIVCAPACMLTRALIASPRAGLQMVAQHRVARRGDHGTVGAGGRRGRTRRGGEDRREKDGCETDGGAPHRTGSGRCSAANSARSSASSGMATQRAGACTALARRAL